MGAYSKIEWTHHTLNPWIGCTQVSPACDHCYAMGPRQALRLGRLERQARAHEQVYVGRALPLEPAGSRAMLADVWDNQAEPAWRLGLFELIKATPHLDWLLLTKRPQNILKMLHACLDSAREQGLDELAAWIAAWLDGIPPFNVWLGTTVENQLEADRRIRHLRRVPATVHFLSCEPVFGRITLDLRDIEWVIAGGESGAGSRPTATADFRYLRDQAAAAAVAFHFKQHGDHIGVSQLTEGFNVLTVDPLTDTVRLGKHRTGRLLDGRTWDELPPPAAGLPAFAGDRARLGRGRLFP